MKIKKELQRAEVQMCCVTNGKVLLKAFIMGYVTPRRDEWLNLSE